MMKKIILAAAALICQLSSVNACAGQDPVSWTLSPASGLPANTLIGSSYALSYTLTNNSPVPLTITTPQSDNASKVTVDDRCDNKTLSANGGTCIVYIGMQPSRGGVHTLNMAINFGRTNIPLPALTTTSASSGVSVFGFVTQPLPPNSQAGTGYPVTFTFRNDSSASITATAVNVTGFTASTNTCTSALAANATCTVTGTYTPAAAGQNSINVNYVYNSGGSKTVAMTSNTITSSTGSCMQLAGVVDLPLPVNTYRYSDNVAKFTFTNHCDATSVPLGTVTVTATQNGTSVNQYVTKGAVSTPYDTCSGQTLAANGSCSVYASVIPTALGAGLSLQASVPYNNGTGIASAITGENVNVIPNQASLHTMMFINQCSYPVWLEFLNGNGNAASTGVLSPDPMPAAARTPQDYLIPAQIGSSPSSKILSTTRYENGKINARTGCDSNMVCKTASCQTLAGKGTCVVGAGAALPSTAFEAFMTNVKATDGVYDVSMVNGFNVPVEIKGLGPVSTSDPFACTAAGAIIQPATSFATQLGACPWTFTPPNTGVNATENYVFVSSGAEQSCTATGGQCTAPQLCGMGWNNDINTGAGVPINRRCGTFQGYWAVADFIGYSNAGNDWGSIIDLYTHYGMSTHLAAAYGNNKATSMPAAFRDLYGCVPTSNDSLDSGYKSGKSRVCGCYDWNQSGSPAKTAVSQLCCTSTSGGACGAQTGVVDTPNTLWQNNVYDKINYLKAACPTAYSYQFDDKSSSFQCNQSGLFTGYVAIFCPGGKTGNPLG